MPVPGSFTERDARAETRLRSYCGVDFLSEFAVRAYRIARFGRGRDADESELEAAKLANLLWDGFGWRYLEEDGDLREAVAEALEEDEVGEREAAEMDGVEEVESRECQANGIHGNQENACQAKTGGRCRKPKKRERGVYHYQLAGEFAQHYLANALREHDAAYMPEIEPDEIADRAVRLTDAVVERLEKN